MGLGYSFIIKLSLAKVELAYNNRIETKEYKEAKHYFANTFLQR